MKVMGHSNYETTLRYTHLLNVTNKKEVDKAGSFIKLGDFHKTRNNHSIKTIRKISKWFEFSLPIDCCLLI